MIRKRYIMLTVKNGLSTNTQTGETYTPEYAKHEIAKLNQKLEH